MKLTDQLDCITWYRFMPDVAALFSWMQSFTWIAKHNKWAKANHNSVMLSGDQFPYSSKMIQYKSAALAL